MKTSSICAALIATLLIGIANAAPAQYECYNFDDLDPAASYTVGDVIDTKHATITIKQYFTNGIPAAADVRGAKSSLSLIAGGTPPAIGRAARADVGTALANNHCNSNNTPVLRMLSAG